MVQDAGLWTLRRRFESDRGYGKMHPLVFLLVEAVGLFAVYMLFLSQMGLLAKIVLFLVFSWWFAECVARAFSSSFVKQESGLFLLFQFPGLVNWISKRVGRRECYKALERLFFFMVFGLFGLILPAGREKRIMLFPALLLNLAFFFLVGPVAAQVLLTVLHLSANSSAQVQDGAAIPLFPAVLAFLGLMPSACLLLFHSAFAVTVGLINMLLNGAAKPAASAVVLLPGINLPLLSGLLALILLLAVHEGGHAVMALAAGLPLERAGVLLVGPLPLGAFVEPNERKLFSSPPRVQLAVLLAGSATNILFSLLLLALLLFLPFKSLVAPLALMLALNAVVGLVNLLPIPFFDGYHALRAILPEFVVNPFAVVVALALLLCFFPHFL